LNGLNKRIITQPAKFCKVPDNAIPIAKPAAHKIAINEVVSTPSIPAAVSINNTFSIAEIIDSTNFLSALSIFALLIALSANLITRAIILNQIQSVSSAPITFGAYDITPPTAISIYFDISIFSNIFYIFK